MLPYIVYDNLPMLRCRSSKPFLVPPRSRIVEIWESLSSCRNTVTRVSPMSSTQMLLHVPNSSGAHGPCRRSGISLDFVESATLNCRNRQQRRTSLANWAAPIVLQTRRSSNFETICTLPHASQPRSRRTLSDARTLSIMMP